MRQQPLDYETPESPPRPPEQVFRRTLGRLVVGSYVVFGVASAFLTFNSSDTDSLQWPAAMFMALSMLVAAVLTVAYCGLVVVLWFRGRAQASKQVRAPE